MKTILLTTDTAHHLYFASKLGHRFSIELIIMETKKINHSFECYHPYEEARALYEKEYLADHSCTRFEDVAEAIYLNDINFEEGLTLLNKYSPELILVFGTGKLTAAVIEQAGTVCLNLHGGNPECYRGLDSHLWAVYHNDYKNLITTLHHVDKNLDTGPIVFQDSIKINKDVKFHQLRMANTEVCLNLAILALNTLNSNGRLPAREQVQSGRYYSAMPAVLKGICLKKYEGYIEKL